MAGIGQRYLRHLMWEQNPDERFDIKRKEYLIMEKHLKKE